jgi:hypothetical protein
MFASVLMMSAPTPWMELLIDTFVPAFTLVATSLGAASLALLSQASQTNDCPSDTNSDIDTFSVAVGFAYISILACAVWNIRCLIVRRRMTTTSKQQYTPINPKRTAQESLIPREDSTLTHRVSDSEI